MPEEKRTHHFSVHLIKPQFTQAKDIIDYTDCAPRIDVPISGAGTGHLFIKKSAARVPKWGELFTGYFNINTLAVPGISAAFVIKVRDRTFVLTFGQGGRFLLRDNVSEERFGLLCTLNSVDETSLRCVDVQTLDAIASHTRIQAGQAASADQFGLDVEQDMLKAVIGTPMDSALGSRMTGSDALSVAVRMDLGDLPALLDQYRQNFEADLSSTNYDWVNNISMVRDPGILADLEARLIKKLNSPDHSNMWLSIPEIINWDTVVGFMYTHGKGTIYPDITLKAFLQTLPDDEQITLELLQRRQVSCANADHQKVFKSWPILKCLYAEMDLGKRKYILNDGRWFSVDLDFVERTNAAFNKIPYSQLQLPEYAGKGEGHYNATVAETQPDRYFLLDDSNKIMHGGGHGQVEVCDLLSIDGQLIHVKHYSKSSVLSHLFSQGFVSGQLIQVDGEFRKKVRAKLKPPFRDLLSESSKPPDGAFTIVYAVISEEKGKRLHLPFFSRVNLNNIRKVLTGFGYAVHLLKILVNDTYAKTVKGRPRKTT